MWPKRVKTLKVSDHILTLLRDGVSGCERGFKKDSDYRGLGSWGMAVS